VNFPLFNGGAARDERDRQTARGDNYSFDISILELLLPLITGAHLTIATERRADANELKRFVAETHITFMQATPTTCGC